LGYLINLDLRGKPAVVVGGGHVAARKIADLLAAGALVKVIAPRVCDEVAGFGRSGRISMLERPFADADVGGAFVVVAATDEETVNARVSAAARNAGILVNVVDRPALCTFTLPAVVRHGDLTIAIATEGQSPGFARALREELESRYGAEYGETVALLGRLRRRMIEQGWDSNRILEATLALHKAGLVRAVGCGDPQALAALIREHLGPGLEDLAGS
jgi:precorrin-2 dehydrogenase/sirohydrochlorin ferrochelatase